MWSSVAPGEQIHGGDNFGLLLKGDDSIMAMNMKINTYFWILNKYIEEMWRYNTLQPHFFLGLYWLINAHFYDHIYIPLNVTYIIGHCVFINRGHRNRWYQSMGDMPEICISYLQSIKLCSRPYLNIKPIFPGIGIPIIMMRWLWNEIFILRSSQHFAIQIPTLSRKSQN